MSAAESVVSSIQHYQKSIHKYHGTPSRVLHCINRLYELPVTVQHLQDTGVGKTINSLKKNGGEVGEAARALVLKWKQMVEEESENEKESGTKSHRNSRYTEDSENENRGEELEKEDRSATVKSRDRKEASKNDHSKSHKRKKESDNINHKEKKHRGEDTLTSSVANSRGHIENEDACSDREWNANSFKNGDHNSDDDEDNFRNSLTEPEMHPSLDQIAHSEDDEHVAPSSDKESSHRKEEDSRRQHKSSKKEKSSSHKHKSKSSSSSSDRNKHSSSSRSEHKESKSSNSSRHKDDKNSSGSSSSSKKIETSATEKNEDKSKSKDKRDKHKDKHRTKDEMKSKDKKEKDEDGVDSFSGIGFGEALGMMFAPDKNKKKTSSGLSSSLSPSKKKSKVSSSSFDRKPQLNLSPEVGPSSSSWNIDQALEVDEDYGLPTLNPNYKPLPQPVFYNSPPKRFQADEDDLTNIMYSKVQRTKVFSGNKTGYTYVPSLFELCTRVLQENIDALEYTGGVPFDLLKPVLERANADQLANLEHYNAYLIEDTDVFWEFHCKKEFRNKNREEMETWRDMYLRCKEERESKLKSLTTTIAAASKAKALPVRKTQLAYIEGTVKPPRGIARKQARFGTAHASASSTSSKQDPSALGSSFTGRPSSLASSGPAVSVPPPRGASGGSSAHSSSCKPKPKAPLMQKALQLIKHNRFKR